MFNSIKSKLLAWFITFSIVVIASFSLFNTLHFKKREKNQQLRQQFDKLENNLLKLFGNSNNFFSLEITNPEFFESAKSRFLENHDSLYQIISRDINYLKDQSRKLNIDLYSEMDSIYYQVNEFDIIFNRIVELIRQRGYKDYGTEGQMRTIIHKLEPLGRINQTTMLMLRRHEKDYIIRNEQQYIQKLNRLTEKFKIEVVQSRTIDKRQKDSVLQILDNYKLLFNKMVSLDQQIGLKNNTALKGRLNTLSANLQGQIARIGYKVEQRDRLLMARLRTVYLTVLLLAILASVIISLLITRKVTHPLIQLTGYVSNITKGEFKTINETFSSKPDAEILMIYREFNRMVNHLGSREKQRDQALAEVRVHELRYRQMADLLPISLFETDLDGNLIYINHRFELSFEYTARELTNINIQDILDKALVAETTGEIPRIEGYETFASTKSGKQFPVLVYITDRRKNNQLLGLRGVVVDITDRVKIIEDLQSAKNKAEESDRLKSAFLANMSHEIRTPMNGILGFTDLLKDEIKDNHKARTYIAQVQNSANLLLKLIDDIIDISIIESGKVVVKKEKFELNQFLDDIYHHYVATLSKKGDDVRFILEKGTSGQLLVRTDPFRLKQVLINLINNAIKFTHHGFIHVSYTIQNESLKFAVRDSGIGIPQEKLNMIFERFRQVDETPNRQYGGTGLGLSISQNLVNLLGGHIHVESEEGKGSLFHFTIPLDVMEILPPTISIPAAVKPVDRFRWDKFTVLIVEDDDTSFRYMKELLSPTGISIVRAASGTTALDFFDNNKIDIVLMDINLPEMNGFEVTRRIRQTDSCVPIVAQTAYAFLEERRKCFEAGCNEYLSKPVKKESFLNVMEKHLPAAVSTSIGNELQTQKN